MRSAWRSRPTGMSAQEQNLEVIANNVANINTTGFKRSRAEFTDLIYQTERLMGVVQPWPRRDHSRRRADRSWRSHSGDPQREHPRYLAPAPGNTARPGDQRARLVSR